MVKGSGGSLAEAVYRYVYDALVRRELEPGDVLDRRRIGVRLGVSLSPVTQAFTRLEQEGFLEVVPRRGTRVRTIRSGDFRAALLFRNALECQAARVYCGASVRADLVRLSALAAAVDSTRSGAAINWEAELAFHRALVALTGCPEYVREYDRAMRLGLFVLVSTFSVRNPFPPDPSGRWHRDLVEGLQTSDPDVAEGLLRRHLEAGREAYLRGE
ncbi:MAG: GntR family transcriptional regulator [Lentisphaeria bacterium]|nr:GntR family transcriptional regulator [Lentisphaeria bacterium]